MKYANNSTDLQYKICFVISLFLPAFLTYAILYYIPCTSFTRACLVVIISLFLLTPLQCCVLEVLSCEDLKAECHMILRYILPITLVLLTSLLVSQCNATVYMRKIPASNAIFYKVGIDIKSVGGAGSVGNEWSYWHYVVCGDDKTPFNNGSVIETKANTAFSLRSRIIEHDDAKSDIGETDSNPIIYVAESNNFLLSNDVRVVEDGGRKNKGAYKDFRVTYSLTRVFPSNASRIAFFYMEDSVLYPISVFLTAIFFIALLDLIHNSIKLINGLLNPSNKEAVQNSLRESKPCKTIAIILAVVACLVGICAAISSKDREADASVTTENAIQTSTVRKAAESTTNSTTIATVKPSANGSAVDYDEIVYVETASNRFHRASCSVKDNSKEMIVKMTRREAVKNKNNPCSACFHD